jgi:hypothetical protein
VAHNDDDDDNNNDSTRYIWGLTVSDFEGIEGREVDHTYSASSFLILVPLPQSSSLKLLVANRMKDGADGSCVSNSDTAIFCNFTC